MAEGDGFGRLVAIMDRLREPGGCPWDREQDYGTLRGYLLEECYEVVEALDRDDAGALCEELGDLLFQIVFLSRIAKERSRFDVNDVIAGITDKMVRRHPHVFGSAEADSAEQVLRHWERIKREEKGDADPGDGGGSLLDGIPTALPALLKAHRLGVKAARVGFDWKGPAEILDKVEEELRELRAALAGGSPGDATEELGDVLFALVMLARHVRADAEAALEGANTKFRRRFALVEAELARQGVRPEEAGLELLERLWQRAKLSEG